MRRTPLAPDNRADSEDAVAEEHRDPFAPVEASPRFATPLAVSAMVLGVLAAITGAEAIAGPLGMVLGLIAHVKGSRLGMPATILAAVGMVIGMAITMLLR